MNMNYLGLPHTSYAFEERKFSLFLSPKQAYIPVPSGLIIDFK